MEVSVKVTKHDGKKREEPICVHGVDLGMLDMRLYGVYTGKFGILNLHKHICGKIEQLYGFPVKNEKDMQGFLNYLGCKGTTFREWFEGYMKQRLLKERNYDYEKIAKEWDESHPDGY